MKIALVRRAYSASGGAEKYLLRLAKALAGHGWTPELVTTQAWPQETWEWGDIHRIEGNSPIEFANAFKKLRPQLQVDFTFSLERVWEADFYRAGDGVHKAWLDRLAKHSNPLSTFIRNRKAKHQQILQLEQSLYNTQSSTKIIANSRLVAQEIQDIYQARSENIQVIHNGYNSPTYTEDEILDMRRKKRAELNLSDNDTTIIFVGSGWKRKGLRYLTDVMPALSQQNVKLLVAGKGKQPSSPPEHTIYLGEVSELTPLYFAADIFSLPTLYDPFSNACLEAASHHLPVITTKDNGFSEAIQKFGGGTAVHDPTNADELLHAIQAWLPAEKRQHAKTDLIQLSEHHTIQRNLDETLDFILSTTT